MKADVLVSGCFNTLHHGHIDLLEFAARLGEVTVAVNNDSYIKQKYGKYAISLVNRTRCLMACRYVHNVIVFNEFDPSKIIYKTKPNIFVRGPDYSGKALPEQQALIDVGCKLVIHQANKVANSSEIVQGLDPGLFDISGSDLLLEPVIDLKQSEQTVPELVSFIF
jgi:cytidyltransferase-like protein